MPICKCKRLVNNFALVLVAVPFIANDWAKAKEMISGRVNVMSNLTKAARSFGYSLIAIAGFSLFSSILQLTIPLYMLQVYDRVLPSKSTDTLLFLSILAGFALVMLGLTEMVRQVLSSRAAAQMDTTLSGNIMEQLVRDGHRSNTGAQPLRDLHTVRSVVAAKSLIGLIDLPFSAVFLICLYFIHPNLFWLTLLGIGALLLTAMLNLQLSKKAGKEQSLAFGSATRFSEATTANADSVVAMGMVGNVTQHWGNIHADELIAADRNARVNATFGGISRTLRFVIQAAILGLGAYLVQIDQMTAGMIFAASIIAGRALQPIDMVINSWPQLHAGWVAWKNVKAFVALEPSRSNHTRVAPPAGKLSVHGILQPNPADPKKSPILNRVSFELPAGQSAAVIGPSGAGKSTLARILVGAHKPCAGEVRLDDNSLENWDTDELGRYVGYLAQDADLLPGTVAQNIARFDVDAKDEDIVKAARMAHVEDLVKQLPQGYDTLVGPGGLQISGGEKQRIALARAFFGTPKLMVLDEPNSSLDREGEKALHKALIEAKKMGITVVLVTQRDSALQSVDIILRMKDGAVTDFDMRDKVIRKYSEKRSATPPLHSANDEPTKVVNF